MILNTGNQQIAQTTKYRSVENLIFKTINVLICSEIHRRYELIYINCEFIDVFELSCLNVSSSITKKSSF